MNRFVLFAFSFLIMVLLGCNKGQLVGEYYLTEDHLSTVPFEGVEEATFLSGQDTFIYECDFRRRFINKESVGINSSDFVYVEYDTTIFQYSSSKIRYANSLNSSYGPQLSITYSGPEDSYGIALHNIPMNLNNLREGQWIQDELEVQGIRHNNVFCDSSLIASSADLEDPKTIYYTQESGIIRIDFYNGKTFELLSMQW